MYKGTFLEVRMKELYKKLHSYEVRIRKIVNSHLHGDFSSIFKGSGLEFDDVRPYQYGDDIRRIDWNTTAKGHGTFLKSFKEEKDQQVLFVLDVSASQEIGKQGSQKIDLAKEIIGVLILSTIQKGSNVGVFCFSDQKELYLKPQKGLKHAYKTIKDLFEYKSISKKTSISDGLKSASTLLKRKSIVIVVSDFIDVDYENALKSLAIRHDVIAIHVHDTTENKLPKLGIIPILDAETNTYRWINSSSSWFKTSTQKKLSTTVENLKSLCNRYQIDYIDISTEHDFVPKLIHLFKVRNKHKKRG